MATFEVITAAQIGGGTPGGGVESIVPGDGIEVDDTDPANPVVSTLGATILKATAELTDAQIKALPTTGVEVVPAPGEGKAINILSCVILLDNSAGAYTNTDGASLLLVSDALQYFSSVIDTGFYLTNAGVHIGTFGIPYLQNGSVPFEGTAVNSTSPLSVVENKAVLIQDNYVGVTDYTGGNAANTLKVTVYYIVVDL